MAKKYFVRSYNWAGDRSRMVYVLNYGDEHLGYDEVKTFNGKLGRGMKKPPSKKALKAAVAEHKAQRQALKELTKGL